MEEPTLDRDQKMQMLKNMLENLEGLPQGAMLSMVTHYDLYSFMLIVYSILDDRAK
jgi:hypothetical protein